VVVPAAVGAVVGEAVEAIQAELPLKGRDLAVLEVQRKDLLLEALVIMDEEAPAVRLPTHDVRVVVRVGVLQQLVQDARERRVDAAPAVLLVGHLLLDVVLGEMAVIVVVVIGVMAPVSLGRQRG